MRAHTLIKRETLENGDYVRIIQYEDGQIVRERRAESGAYESRRLCKGAGSPECHAIHPGQAHAWYIEKNATRDSFARAR